MHDEGVDGDKGSKEPEGAEGSEGVSAQALQISLLLELGAQVHNLPNP